MSEPRNPIDVLDEQLAAIAIALGLPAAAPHSQVLARCAETAFSMPIEQVDAELRAAGGDPEAIGRRGAAIAAEAMRARAGRGRFSVSEEHVSTERSAIVDLINAAMQVASDSYLRNGRGWSRYEVDVSDMHALMAACRVLSDHREAHADAILAGLGAVADYGQPAEEAEAELQADGVDVEAFRGRIALILAAAGAQPSESAYLAGQPPVPTPDPAVAHCGVCAHTRGQHSEDEGWACYAPGCKCAYFAAFPEGSP